MPGSVTATAIANSALIKLGCDRISDLTENSKGAILITAGYGQWRDEVMRDHPWRSFLTRAQLSPNATTPAFEYDYTYDIPNDCLRVWTVMDSNGNDDIPWTREGNTVLSNESVLNVQYIQSGIDESLWDTAFAEAFSWKIAANLAYAMTANMELAQACEQQYQRMLALARSVSGTEGIIKGLVADGWTNSRRGGSRSHPATGFGTSEGEFN